MAIADPAPWIALALFNLGLGWMLLSVRPGRTANVLAALLVGANGLFAIKEAALRVYFGDSLNHLSVATNNVDQAANMALNLPVYVAFMALPFFFPVRRLKRRGERILLATLLAYSILNLGLVVLQPPVILNTFRDAFSALIMFFPFYMGLAFGTASYLNLFLTSPSMLQRRQAQFVLTAYLLKICGVTYEMVDAFVVLHIQLRTLLDGLVVVASFILLAVPLLAVPAGILSSRLRRTDASRPPRQWRQDLFVLAPFALIPILSMPPIEGHELEYMLLRPLVLTYGILQFQLLELDLRRSASIVAVSLLAASTAAYLVIVDVLDNVHVPTAQSVGIGLVLLLGLGGLLAWPLLRVLLSHRPPSGNDRGHALYQAALESAVADRSGHDTSHESILRALRQRLGISDREHAVMELSVRETFGQRPENLQPGDRFLDRYAVERLLGEGGFGRTFLATDEQMGRRVVLKVARAPDAEDAKRMLREARIVSKLQHPHVVTIYDVEQVGKECVLVIEFVEGGSLADRLAQGPLPLEHVLALLDDVLAALQTAHAKQIVHRDVKPANILLTLDGRAKLADFGIARAPPGTGTASGLSLAGQQPGSLRYMSPEQVRGGHVDGRSDLYSLAVVAYEALTGRPYLNFKGRTDFDQRLAILEERPRLPLPRVPKFLNELLAGALSKDADSRPNNAEEMRKRIASGFTVVTSAR